MPIFHKYTYQQYISDLNGIDTKAHNNDPVTALKQVHSWLNTVSRRKIIPGERILQTQFDEFEKVLPTFVGNIGYYLNTLPYLNLLDIIQESVAHRMN